MPIIVECSHIGGSVEREISLVLWLCVRLVLHRVDIENHGILHGMCFPYVAL